MTVLRLGTRASQLALIQSRAVAAMLEAAHPGLSVELIPISTAGDRDRTSSLASGRGWFTTAIQEALLREEIDLAVHSYKDLPSVAPAGLVVAAVPLREDPRDALVSQRGETLAALPPGAVVGTSSPRRSVQLRHLRPDLIVRPIRGNVETRIAKVRRGEFSATILARAGLKRLGREGDASQVLEPAEMMPAPAQGALAVECRRDDASTRECLAAIDDPRVRVLVASERAFLRTLQAGCQFPAAAHAMWTPGGLRVSGLIASGDEIHRGEEEGAVEEAESLGTGLARRLLERAGMGGGGGS